MATPSTEAAHTGTERLNAKIGSKERMDRIIQRE
jgi:hypothetical protein